MSCPTCGGTMEHIAQTSYRFNAYFWCPRCGTLKWIQGDREEVSAPKLVERVRQFRDSWGGVEFDKRWHRLGIQEAITPENER
jgi:hypothetical protein